MPGCTPEHTNRERKFFTCIWHSKLANHPHRCKFKLNGSVVSLPFWVEEAKEIDPGNCRMCKAHQTETQR